MPTEFSNYKKTVCADLRIIFTLFYLLAYLIIIPVPLATIVCFWSITDLLQVAHINVLVFSSWLRFFRLLFRPMLMLEYNLFAAVLTADADPILLKDVV
jgi:hypothetical protein